MTNHYDNLLQAIQRERYKSIRIHALTLLLITDKTDLFRPLLYHVSFNVIKILLRCKPPLFMTTK